MLENNAQVDFNENDLHNDHFGKGYSLPAASYYLISKQYVNDAIEGISLFKSNQDKIFNFTSINSNTVKTQAVKDNQVLRKSYVDQFHQENERSRRDIEIHFYNESSDLVKSNQTLFLTTTNQRSWLVQPLIEILFQTTKKQTKKTLMTH